MPTCRHLDVLAAAAPTPHGAGCAACIAAGQTWVHLRRCQTCGYVGCCDQRPGRHARAHFRETGHPVVRSAQGREEWSFCYLDAVEYDPAEDWDREGASLD